MWKYIVKRLLQLIPVLLALVLLVYFIMFITPGDATLTILGNEWTPEGAEVLREELGLNRPFIVQYADYVWSIISKGDFGTSYVDGLPVSNQINARIGNTLILTLGAMIFCVAVSIPSGIISAVRPNSVFSAIMTGVSFIGLSMPCFWLGLLLILLFSVRLGWLPALGLDGTFKSVILPSITLGASYMAATMRTTRSSMLESLHMDFIRTARSKGVSRKKLIYKHALGNSWLPTITVIGLNVGSLIGGAVITETTFSIAGLGRMLVSSISARDVPCVLAVLIVMGVGVGIATLIVDIICAYVDPRIKAKYIGRN